MPDWSGLRRRAYEQHRRLRARLPDGTSLLPPADLLLDAAAKETGLRRTALPPDDPLLSEAYAVLDREAGRVWYAHGRGISLARQRFAQAHEFGHFWLHGDLPWDACEADDSSEAFLPPSARSQSAQVAEGYGPRERRETEANLFAAGFLLPGSVLRRVYTELGWNADRIAAHTGLSESCVLSQLAHALLLPSALESADLAESAGADPFSLSSSGNGPLDGLDESQRVAAEIEHGPALVDAGPGTGKTRTLVARILFLLRQQRVPPDNILAVTFTNKAAEEMRTRLRLAVGDAADRVWIGTFHAFGFELLRKEGHRLSLPPAPGLLETADAVTLLERHLDRLELSEFEFLHQPSLPFVDILGCISRAKDELKTPADYRAAALRQLEAAGEDEDRQRAARKSLEIAHVYAVYQELLQAHGLLDFGDLILRAVELLDTCPDVLARWQAQYPQVLADEYQDVNRASAQLLRRVAGNGSGFWAVGDLRQTICRFRGAAPANVTAFERDFPGGRRLQLQRNYRSQPPLVSLFSTMAALMTSMPLSEKTRGIPIPEATDVTTWEPHRVHDGQPAITVAVAEDADVQADGLAAQILERQMAGVPYRDQAVLCRTNRQATTLAEQLEQRGIPVQHLGDLFDRTEIKDLLALISLASEAHGMALARVAQFPEYAVPMADVTRLCEAAREQQRAFPSALQLAAELPDLSEAGRQGLMRLWAQLEPILYRGDAWMLLTRYLFSSSAYLRPLLADETIANRRKLLAISQLLQVTQRLSRKLQASEGESGQAAFLAHLFHLRMCGEDRFARLPEDADALDAVRLLTIHVSKGLEFPVVYLPNLTESQFSGRAPSRMASPPPGLLEDALSDGEAEADTIDDSCLFFVALSRARDHLVLSRPAQWRGKETVSFRLLEGIEPALSACGAQRVLWTRAAPEAQVGADVESESRSADGTTIPEGAEARPTVTLSALELYADCPRKFYYRYVARLSGSTEASTYSAFYSCMQQTLRWLQAERAAQRTPSREEAQERLDMLWSEQMPEMEGAHARLLRRHAEAMIENAHSHIGDSPEILPELELVADLPNGSVRIRCDQAERLPDGTLRLARYSTSRPTQKDTNTRRYALMRHAARQQDPERPVQVSVTLLRDGATKVPREMKHHDQRYLSEHNEALAGIRDGQFDPKPEDRKCAECPYFLICPS